MNRTLSLCGVALAVACAAGVPGAQAAVLSCPGEITVDLTKTYTFTLPVQIDGGSEPVWDPSLTLIDLGYTDTVRFTMEHVLFGPEWLPNYYTPDPLDPEAYAQVLRVETVVPPTLTTLQVQMSVAPGTPLGNYAIGIRDSSMVEPVEFQTLVNINLVPEPATALLLGLGAVLLRRRQK